MPSFAIQIELGHLIPPDAPLSKEVFAHLAYAVNRISEAAQQKWQSYALGAPLPSGLAITPRSGTYARSIQTESEGDFRAVVFSNLAYASAIEEGIPARDLKAMLFTSNKTRLSKAGKRYLVIPMRWGTPGTVTFHNVMSQEAYDLWRGGALRSSSIRGRYREPSVNHPGRTVNRFRYLWGSRLGGTSHPHEAGMVRFAKQNAKGGGAHSRYLTFRTLSESSDGWMVPPVPGKYPARTVAEQLSPLAEKAFQEAVSRDVRALLTGG